MAGRQLACELRRRIDRRVHLTRQLLLRRSKGIHDFRKRDRAHDAQVHVAVLSGLPACDRPVDKREAHAADQRLQSGPQHVRYTGRFQHDTAQLGKDGALVVGLKEHLPSPREAPDDSGLLQPLQLTLRRPLASAGVAGHLAQVEGLVRVA